MAMIRVGITFKAIFRPIFEVIFIFFITGMTAPTDGLSSVDEPNKTASKVLLGDQQWPEKAHDSIRFSIITHDYLGAWKSVQLLIRTDTAIEYLEYYEKLSALLAGACPLSLAPEPVAFDHLLRAYAARFYRKFSKSEFDLIKPMESADAGRDVTHLNISQTPYLEDLKTIKLLKGSGCRLSRQSFSSELDAEHAEFEHLKKYLNYVDSGAFTPLRGDVRVRIRLLELATRRGDPATAKQLLQGLTSLNSEPWMEMSEADRRFLWSMLQSNQIVPQDVVRDGSKEDALIESLIKASSKDEVAYWLGLAPLDQWTTKRKKEVFSAVDGLGPFPGRSAVILRRAILAYEGGKPREALEFIRRILAPEMDSTESMQGMNGAEDSTEALALQLVEKILSEFKYDQAVVAAVRTSIPSIHWRRIYRGLLLQYALRGDPRGYARLKTQLNAKQPSGVTGARMTEESIAVLDAMVHREIPKLSKILKALSEDLRSEFIRLSKDVAVRVAAYTDDEFTLAAPVLNPFLPMLEKQRASGRQSGDLEDVIRILGRLRKDKIEVTERAIHGGVTHAGAANIRPLFNLSNPFLWVPLERNPLSSLLALPDEAKSRGWQIQ
jgi:hypothetical protein